MSRVGRFFRAPVLVSKASVLMLAASSFVAIIGLFLALVFAQQQAEASDAKAECRSRVVGYVAGVEQVRDSAGWRGLLAAVDTGDVPDEDLEIAREASDRLDGDLATLREQLVDLCAADPDFDPVTYEGSSEDE